MSSDDVDAFILSFSYSSFFTKQKKTLFMIFLFMIVFKINEAIPMTKSDNITYSLPNKTRIPIVFLWKRLSGNGLLEMQGGD